MFEILADKALDEESEQQVNNPRILLWASELAGLGSHEIAIADERLSHLGVAIQFLGHHLLHLLIVAHPNQETATLNQTTAVGAA